MGKKEKKNYCQCGCGEKCVNKFVMNHSKRTKNFVNGEKIVRYCLCGCGEVVDNKFVKGHQRGENNPMYGKFHTDETKQKISEKHTGKVLTEDHKQKIRDSAIDNENYGMKGKSHTELSKNILRKKSLERFSNPENHPWLGRQHTEETKQKISKSNIGKECSEELREKRSINSLKMWDDEEFKEKMSEMRTGENNPNWKGGITKLADSIRTCSKYSNWRIDVFRRDNFTCQKCNKHGGDLEAHHIKRFIDIINDNNIETMEAAQECQELWDVDNGQTLCKECHAEETFSTVNIN